MLYLIQNDPVVPPGLYGEHLQARGIAHQCVRLDQADALPDPSALQGAIVLGGNMSVDDVADFPFLLSLQTWLRQVTEAGRPLLGICLGGQLLARALGGRVHRERRGERGIHQVQLLAAVADDPLLQNLPQTFSSLQWHHDSFDPPPGSRLLASSPACPGQLFHVAPCSYGLQFHPEADAEIIRAWSRRAGLDDEILDRYLDQAESIRAASLTLLDNFLTRCGFSG